MGIVKEALVHGYYLQLNAIHYESASWRMLVLSFLLRNKKIIKFIGPFQLLYSNTVRTK